MGIHSRWTTDGNLVFYDTATTDLLTITKTGKGIIANQNIYLGTTSYNLATTAGVSWVGTTSPGSMTVVNGIITAISSG